MAILNKNIEVKNEIFSALEQLQLFCRDHGFRFNEADLYSPKSFIWQQWLKKQNGKPTRNNWDDQLLRRSSYYRK